MNPLNLCIDIDGTITEPYYWLEKTNLYFHTNIQPKDITVYEIYKVLGISRQEYLDFYNQCGEELHMHATIREDAKEILHELGELNHIHYVTARDKRMEYVTNKWIQSNELPHGKVYLLGSHYKAEKAKELNCNIFIEDRYENAIELALAGFKVLLIDCEYNQGHLIDSITRVYNWKEIYKEVINYRDKKQKNNEEIA